MSDSKSEATVSTPSLAVRGVMAVLVAVVVNAVLVVVVDRLALAPGFRPLTLPPVVFLSAVGAVGATVTYWACRRYATDPERTFVRLAGAVLALSVLPDLALLAFDPAATPLGVVLLVVMHVVVAGGAVGALVYWNRDG